jgi:hypothetical protein
LGALGFWDRKRLEMSWLLLLSVCFYSLFYGFGQGVVWEEKEWGQEETQAEGGTKKGSDKGSQAALI